MFKKRFQPISEFQWGQDFGIRSIRALLLRTRRRSTQNQHHRLARMDLSSTFPPDINFNPSVKQFLEKFYALSDDISVTPQKYAEQFKEDATLHMGVAKCSGRSG